MDDFGFAQFEPINLSSDKVRENMVKYYAENGIEPNNSYLKNYLEDTITAQTTKEESLPVTTVKNSVENILGSVDFDLGRFKNPALKRLVPKAPNAEVTTSGNPREFMEKYKDIAKAASKETGISEDLMLAQLALESGWGKSAPGYNFGGIKADKSWKGEKSNLSTTEYSKQKGYHKSNEAFRKYSSAEEGFRGYVDFLLRNPRYKSVIGVDDPMLAAEMMGRTGYATDPNYGEKLKSMVQTVQKYKK